MYECFGIEEPSKEFLFCCLSHDDLILDTSIKTRMPILGGSHYQFTIKMLRTIVVFASIAAISGQDIVASTDDLGATGSEVPALDTTQSDSALAGAKAVIQSV